MAKDDFSVIACIILSYLYESIKKGRAVQADYLHHTYFHTNEAYFQFIIEELYCAGYITGCHIESWKGGRCVLLTDDLKITMAGIEYLETNDMMTKARRALPEMRGRMETLLKLLQLAV